MTKEEIKDKISMALKDPILQQGFEIICKENAELKEKLTKAKEIIKSLMLFAEIDCREYEEAYKKAEQFLKEVSE